MDIDNSFDTSIANVADTLPIDDHEPECVDDAVRKLDTVFAASLAECANNPNSLQLFLRIRPNQDGSDEESTIKVLNKTTILTTPPEMSQVSRIQKSGPKEFVFSRVFDDTTTQKQLFDETISEMVDNALDGSNGLAFTYGMTNSGKTYTVLGTHTDPGILPKSLQKILSSSKLTSGKVTVSISVFEIYNERIYDLLGTAKRRVALQLQDRMGKVQVKGLSRHFIPTMDSAMSLLDRAQSSRRAASTALNQDSSRSHGIFSIEIRHKKDMKLEKQSDVGDDDIYEDEEEDELSDLDDNDDDSTSVLWIVDLAGSERAIRTGAGGTGIRQQEANTINKSLMNLFRCLDSIRKKQDNTAHIEESSASNADGKPSRPSTICVPFRESKLTHLFMNHLAGSQTNSTQLIVTINPHPLDYDETQHVLSNSAIATKVRLQTDLSRENRANYLINSSIYDFNGRRIEGKGETTGQVAVAPVVVNGTLNNSTTSASVANINNDTKGGKNEFSVRLSQTGGRIGKLGIRQESSSLAIASSSSSSHHQTLHPPPRGPLSKSTSVNSILSSISLNQDQQTAITAIVNQNEDLKKHVSDLTEQLLMVEEKTRRDVLKQVSIQEMLQQQATGDVALSKKMQINNEDGDDTSRVAQDDGQCALTSTKKLKLNRLMVLVDEMQDRLEECEEEMNRMKDDNYREVSHIKTILKQACQLLKEHDIKFESDWLKCSEVLVRRSSDFKRKRSDCDDDDDEEDNDMPLQKIIPPPKYGNMSKLVSIQEEENTNQDENDDQIKKRSRNEEDEEFELRRARDARLQQQPTKPLQFVPLKRISDANQGHLSNSDAKKKKEIVVRVQEVPQPAKLVESVISTSSNSDKQPKPAIPTKKNLMKSFFGLGTPISKRLRSTSKSGNE